LLSEDTEGGVQSISALLFPKSGDLKVNCELSGCGNSGWG